jgi:quercetin dioxygenase-like cupin family protein
MVLLEGAASGGQCSVSRLTCHPGPGAPLHRHNQVESFLIVEGRLRVHVDGVDYDLEPGDFVRVPEGLPHGFSNITEEECVFLSIATPAGHEHFFRDADALAKTGGFFPAAAAEMCLRHGIELVSPQADGGQSTPASSAGS